MAGKEVVTSQIIDLEELQRAQHERDRTVASLQAQINGINIVSEGAWDKLQRQITAGEATSGNPLLDHVLSVYGIDHEKYLPLYVNAATEIAAHPGELILLIRWGERSAFTHSGDPNDFVLTKKVLIGIVEGKDPIINPVDQAFFPTGNRYVKHSRDISDHPNLLTGRNIPMDLSELTRKLEPRGPMARQSQRELGITSYEELHIGDAAVLERLHSFRLSPVPVDECLSLLGREPNTNLPLF